VGELRLTAAPPRRELLRLLGARLGDVVSGWQPLAEDVLGADARIDLVGADASGCAVAVLVGAAGDDLELIGRGLAQRAWLAPRVRDWVQLAPGLPLDPDAGAQAVLLCPSFRPEAIAAARAAATPPLALAAMRFLRDGAELEVLLERIEVALPVDRPAAAPRGAASPAPFRTGLTDEDLALTRDEQAEFE
jgi:hypothetical protein